MRKELKKISKYPCDEEIKDEYIKYLTNYSFKEFVEYCQENDDDFYISPEVMKELKSLARDHRLLTQDLDKLSDEELAEFMEEMNEIDAFDENNFDDDFDWDEAEENMFEEFEDEYDIEDEDYNIIDDLDF